MNTPYEDLVFGRWPGEDKVGQRLTELRRSNAAGKHGKTRRDRRNTERRAVERDQQDSA